MRICRTSLSALFLISLLLLSACDVVVITPLLESPAPGLVETLAAQTVQADEQITSLLLTATAPRIPNTPIPTETPQPTNTLPPSRTPLPSITPSPTSATPIVTISVDGTLPPPTVMPDGTKILCNAAQYIRDVTVPDAMKVRPGEHFTKVWELKNAGYCTWTPDYKIILTWGNPMGTEPPLPFGKTVLPGESVEISIKMVAPYIPLCWQGNWMLQDPLGNRFGVGVEHANAFYVLVFVHIPGLSRFLATCEEE